MSAGGVLESLLVMRAGALGDFVLSAPLLAAVRSQRPRARVDLVAGGRPGALATACGLADRTLSVDRREVAMLFERDPDMPPEWAAYLRGFDAVVCLFHDPDGAVARNLARAGVARLVRHSPMVRGGHAEDHFLRAAAALGLDAVPARRPLLRLAPGAGERGRLLAQAMGPKTLAIAPGSGAASKNWPLERYLALAARLRADGVCEPAFLLGEAEDGMRGRIESAGMRAAGGLEIVDAAAWLVAARGCLGNDSGITHVAAALGVPTVAVFGPTDPGVWGPRGPHVTILRAASARMEDLAEEDVCAAVRARLAP